MNLWDFFQAVEKGDLPTVQKYLNKYSQCIHWRLADIRGWLRSPLTPLSSAAYEGHIDIVKLFLAKGANIDYNAEDGTPLSYACSRGWIEIVQLLLDANANIECRYRDERTPLMEATVYGHKKIVEMLLDRGADMYITLDMGDNAFVRATLTLREDIIKLFLTKGYDIDYENKYGDTALMMIMNSFEVDKIKIESAKILLRHGANIHKINKYGHDVLYYAAVSRKNYTFVEFLIQNMQDRREEPYRSQFFENALAAILMESDYELSSVKISKAFIDNLDMSDRSERLVAMAAKNVLRYNNSTASYKEGVAVWRGSTFSQQEKDATFKLLVNIGANVEEYIFTGRDKTTVLHVAVDINDMEIVQFLVENRHVNLDKLDGLDHTALAVAVQNGHFPIADYLIIHGANVNVKNGASHNPLIDSIYKKATSTIDLILQSDSNVDVNAYDFYGYTPLMPAIASGDKDIIQKLIEKKVKVSGDNSKYLHFISRCFCIDGPGIAKILMEHGARNDINTQDDDGYTPLMRSVFRQEISMVEFFISNGADITKVNKKGESAIDMLYRGDIVELLKDVQRFDVAPNSEEFYECAWAQQRKACMNEMSIAGEIGVQDIDH